MFPHPGRAADPALDLLLPFTGTAPIRLPDQAALLRPSSAWPTLLHAARDEPVVEVAGLPYVRVVRRGTGGFLTSSRLEAHRLASPFIHTATLAGKPMFDEIRQRLGLAQDTPLNRRHMADAVAGLDPFCLLHGVFFSQIN